MDARDVGILVIGTEMVHGTRLDTNSQWLARHLTRLGYRVRFRITAGDRRGDILRALAILAEEVRTIFLLGGLGPTHDDITREAVARWSGRSLREHAEVRSRMEQLFRQRGIQPPEDVFRMAQVLEGAEVLWNDVGTAPGQWLQVGEHILVLLPGPPGELKDVFRHHVEPRLRELIQWPEPRYHRMRTAALAESEVSSRLRDLMDRAPYVQFTFLAAPGQVDVEFLCAGHMDAASWKALVDEVRSRLEPAVFSEDDALLEQVVGQILRDRGATLAVAESCTGGLIGHRITNVPGSSDYFMTGFVVYSNAAKIQFLGVQKETLEQHGAVSEAVALEMARGARERARTTWSLAVTGIAGPTGGTPEKPVGTVHIAVAGPDLVYHRRYLFHGSRDTIKQVSSQYALEMLRRVLLGLPLPDYP